MLNEDSALHQKRRAFLSAYAATGNISDAAAAVGISRSRHYAWLSDSDYAEAFDHASEQAADRLEREAVRRAVEGVEKTIYYRGEPVGTERVYSDVLLIFLLKGLRPEKYRDNWRPPEPTEPVRTPWDPEIVRAEARRRAESIRPLSVEAG